MVDFCKDESDYLPRSFLPDWLWYDAPKIQSLERRLFGRPYRFWRMGEIKFYETSNNKGTVWLSGINLYVRGINECDATDVTPQIQSVTANKPVGGPPSWFTGFAGESVGGVENLIDDQPYTSTIFYLNYTSNVDRLELTFDFGPGNSEAISAITQSGVRLPCQSIESFVLYASNDGENWVEIANYQNLPDPIEEGYFPALTRYAKTGSMFRPSYGVPEDYCKTPANRDQLYNKSSFIVVWHDLTKNHILPTEFDDQRSEQRQNRFRFWVFYGLENAVEGANALSTDEIQLFADGSLYHRGSQFNPGRLVNDKIQRIYAVSNFIEDNDSDFERNILVGNKTLRLTPSANDEAYYGFNLFKLDKTPGYLNLNGLRQAYVIDFGEGNEQNITSIRQVVNKQFSEINWIKNIKVMAFNREYHEPTNKFYSDENVNTIYFGNTAGDTGEVLKVYFKDLSDPRIESRSIFGNKWVSKHYILLRTAEEYALFPGDATRMWDYPYMNQIKDVDADSAVDGDVLVFNDSDRRWKTQQIQTGGEALWKWDNNIYSSNFKGNEGYYHFVDASGGTVTVTLPGPDSSEIGDLMLFRVLGEENFLNFSSTANIEGNSFPVEYETTSFGFPQMHVGFYYLDSANGWTVFMGGISAIVG